METEKVPDKTQNEILNQLYLSAYDLKLLIPTMTYARALECIKEIRIEMEEKGYYVPEGKTKIALTKLVRKKFGF